VFDADNAVELLRAVVEVHGDADAYVEADGTRISFAQWQRAADGVAAGLSELGVGVGDVVCLMLRSSIDYAVCYQAAMRLGAITSGINLRLGPIEVGHILERTAPALVVVDDVEPPVGRVHLHRRDLSELARLDPGCLPGLRADQPVAIVWTSGTTGKPKGAVFDHRNLRAVAAAVGPLSAPFDRRLSPLPFAHVGTMTRQWDEIANVVAVVITPTPWRAGDALGLMERERVTVGQGVPTQWELVLRHPDLAMADLSSLRLVASGGSRVPADLVARLRDALGVPVLNRYASTEAAVVSGTRPDDPDRVVVETVGRPGEGVELRVVGADGDPLPDGEPGRVQVRSAAVMGGYWRDPALTAQVLHADGWLDLGDVGTVGSDGNLRFLARKSELYLRGGYNVYPGEVEQVLREHSLIEQVAVIGVPDPVLGELGHAFVVTTGELELDEVRRWVRGQLADYKAPDRLTLVDDLPLTSMGKVDRTALRGAAEQAGTRR
jgi:acyl-CoA synthetase (AMP-forming)/AMP-acid ligase II